MDVYRNVAHRVGTPDALELANELREWHDAMVTHERMLRRSGVDEEPADEDCPHTEAVVLWTRAQRILGTYARELTFLQRSAEGR